MNDYKQIMIRERIMMEVNNKGMNDDKVMNNYKGIDNIKK
jgi:hypothetical protein